MFVVQFGGLTQREEELAGIIVRSGISHSQQPTPVEPQTCVELILELKDGRSDSDHNWYTITKVKRHWH